MNVSYATDYETKIRLAEKKHGIPKGLLLSIAKVESRMHPWTVNSPQGELYAKTKEEAASKIQKLLAEGITNIDVGISQLNFRWHGKKFLEVHDMLEPEKNIDYAARFLVELYKQHKEWHLATGYYHSYNPANYKRYLKKVLIVWLQDTN